MIRTKIVAVPKGSATSVLNYKSNNGSSSISPSTGSGSSSSGGDSSKYCLWQTGDGDTSIISKGSGDLTSNMHEVAIGQYNKTTRDKTSFSVGNGTGSNNRSNAFEIQNDGTAIATTFKSSSVNTTTVNTATVNSTNINNSENIVNGGDITNTGNFSNGGDITNDGNITNTGVLKTADANVDNDLTVGKSVTTKTINADGGNIKDIYSDNITNKKMIKTKDLTVTGTAHFFELIIDKVKSSGGAAIFTPVDGFDIDVVEAVENGYKLYWRCEVDGKVRQNMWKANDQAICMSFNQGEIEVNYNVSNKYYWSLVTAVNDYDKPVTREDGNKYNWITISTTTFDGTVNPEVGDSIAMLGYRGTDDEKRQSAIYITAYASFDKGVEAPFIAQYKGIKDFDIEKYRTSWWSLNTNKFVGDFVIESSGKNVVDFINEQVKVVDGKIDDSVTSLNTTINEKYSSLNATVDSINTKVVNNTTSITRLGENLDATNKNLEETNKNLGTTNGNITALEKTVKENYSTLDQKADSIDAKVVANTNSITKLGTNLETTNSNITKLETTVNDKYAELNVKADGISGKVEDNTKKITVLSSNLEATNSNITTLETTVSNNYSTLDQKADGISTKVSENTTKITKLGENLNATNESITSLQKTVADNYSTLDQKADGISAKVSSNTTSINNINGQVTTNKTDIANLTIKADGIESTVSSVKDDIIGENCMLGLNGQGWSNNTIYEDAGTSFHCESTDWFQSHPIADFSGDYTFSFGVWGGGIQIKILEFTQTYYDDGIYNQYVDFRTYTPCKILTTSSSVPNANLTNYATSGTLSTWTYTNTETITLTVGDKVAVRVTNSTNNRYNSIYGTVSAINTSSKSVTVKAIKLLDQPNTICTLSCPTDKKDGTDINSLHYDEKLGRWWIRFKESSGAAKTFVILFRNPSTSIIGYISRLMIEESVEYPHKYNSTGQASQSMIKQTAESIMMSVNDTYVKIGDGNITLNGDTKVNGSLTLNDEDQGFLLLGDSGTTEISPKSIGTYNEFKSKTTNTIKTHFNSTIFGSPTVDGALYGFSWNVQQKLGTFKKGSYIRVIDYTNVAFANVGTLQYSIGTPSATFYIHENGTLTKTITVGDKTSVDIGNYTVVGDNVEVMVTGRFTKNVSASIWGTSQDILSPRDTNITIQPIKPMPSITVNVDWKNEVPTASAFMLIGYDGFAVNFGNNKTVYCGADGFIASYGINEFKITSDGIWRNNHPNVKVLKGTDNSDSPATYTVQAPVDTVLCVGRYCKVIFPPNPYEGQTFRILDKALSETYINSNGKKVVNHKTGGDGKVLNLDYLGGQVFWTYVYIDGRWYESAES